jgi:hypothetical protein
VCVVVREGVVGCWLKGWEEKSRETNFFSGGLWWLWETGGTYYVLCALS